MPGLHAGGDHPSAPRRGGGREPVLHPRLGPAQQLPPARRQRAHRRLPLRQRRRLADFEAFELLDTKRIEIYKGGNALRYGGNTLGGALNLITKTGYDAGLFEIRSEAGSFGFLKNHLATGQVYGPLDFYTGLSDTEIDGYRDHAQQARRRHYSTLGYRLGGGATRFASTSTT